MLALLCTLLVALFLSGIINRTRALCSGRKGIRLFQHLYDLRVLLRKGSVYSSTSGLLFRIAPAVYLGTILVATLFVPLGGLPPFLSGSCDFVLFAYLLALSRFTLILAALDTGSSFEGMGASREACYGALVEPALFLVFGTLALLSGYTNFTEIFGSLRGSSPETIVILLLTAYILLKILLVESGRVPIDDPRTHLELTMIHEVMILDYSGIDLALIQIASHLKMALLAVFTASIVASMFTAQGISVGLVLVLVATIGITIGIIESFQARNRLSRNATYILAIAVVALVAFIVTFLLSLHIQIA